MTRYDPAEAARRLDAMLDAYEHEPFSVSAPREQGTYVRHAIESSPELKRNLLAAIGEGVLERFDAGTTPGAGASYSASTRSMSIPYPDAGHPMELVFVLGHETQHALNTHHHHHLEQTFLPAVDAISRSAERPHDYTEPLRGRIEASLDSEARAEIGGFNAVISAMQQAGMTVDAADIARTMPSRSRDFLTLAPDDTQGYVWRDLTREADGTLPFTAANVDAMKANYADGLPGSFGANGLLDYRHQAIVSGLEFVQSFEKARHAESAHPQSALPSLVAMNLREAEGGPIAGIPVNDPNRAPPPEAATVATYHVDFAALGASRAVLDYPSDGMIAVKDPAVLAFPPFSHDHPDFVVERSQALRNLGLPPDRPPLEWSGPPPLPPQPVPESLHPLHRTAMESLDRLGPIPGLPGFCQQTDAAAAIALKAAEQGMARVDHVLLSRDGNGLILVQGEDPSAPHAKRARVDVAGMVLAEQSLERLNAQTQTFESSPQLDRQRDEERSQGAPAIAARSL